MIEMRMLIQEDDGGRLDVHLFRKSQEATTDELAMEDMIECMVRAGQEKYLKSAGGGTITERRGRP